MEVNPGGISFALVSLVINRRVNFIFTKHCSNFRAFFGNFLPHLFGDKLDKGLFGVVENKENCLHWRQKEMMCSLLWQEKGIPLSYLSLAGKYQRDAEVLRYRGVCAYKRGQRAWLLLLTGVPIPCE